MLLTKPPVNVSARKTRTEKRMPTHLIDPYDQNELNPIKANRRINPETSKERNNKDWKILKFNRFFFSGEINNIYSRIQVALSFPILFSMALGAVPTIFFLSLLTS